ncbi:salicylate hydroxylase [Sporothrix schenckii 1099-18]|uniref:Salicylate hydroxylase n=1 Tax=Sporothrix schenckii 1099-18 TaxID=1397361 RepID=A0A0F2M9F1_SPOSC|nr:salicylate hydroxylase [Sporothrix schenckii 1099-18]KJR86272.1 salicylate hydroxylase [Sporothrix schenckii 1099-18]
MSDDTAPLHVVIVGAGIGGLTAAVGLRAEGHRVTLLERSQLAQETGAAIHLAPNCHGLLKRFGIQPTSFGANPLEGIAEYDGAGNLKMDINLRGAGGMWQHPWVLSHRVSLHNELKRVATAEAGDGPPAVLKVGSRVVSVDPETATVTLEDGTTVSGDLVLGADGVSSVTRSCIGGDTIKPFPSGGSAFRFLVPRQKVLDNPSTAHLGARPERDGYMTMWYGRDRRLVMYPCVNNTVLNFVGLHPSALTSTDSNSKSTWSGEGSKTALLDVYKEFGPAVHDLLSLVDSADLKLWTLLDMDQLPSWTTGKLALLGDAAHPFLPHQGQGGGMAIEDAASLVALLRAGTPRSELPGRLALYQDIRMYRAHKVQADTRQAGADIVDGQTPLFNVQEFNFYNFAYDEWHNTSHRLNQWLWARHGPAYRRQPSVFGPAPGPRQDALGRPVDAPQATFRTTSIRFKTSATYLQTLFPTPAFKFARPGTVVEATFKCNELDRLPWLGGGGYRFAGLWVHGVQYTKTKDKDGAALFGSYLPVLFEDLTDPILSGRDELGMPKLFASIAVETKDAATDIRLSWRGTEFVRMTVDHLESVPAPTPGEAAAAAAAAAPVSPFAPKPAPDDGDFFYRYVPAVGQPGTADAEYPVFLPHKDSTTSRVVEATQVTQQASLTFQAGSQTSLPTLHHIAAALAEIPVYGIVKATVEEGHGVDNFAHAQRIE